MQKSRRFRAICITKRQMVGKGLCPVLGPTLDGSNVDQ